MSQSIAKYKAMLAQLLPPGDAFKNTDGWLGRVLESIAAELVRVDTRTDDLIREADPRTTYELLPDWERVCGLPDECTGAGKTVEERVQILVAKLIQRGGQSRAFFKELAAALGYDADIIEFEPFCAGSSAGDPDYNNDWSHAFALVIPDEITVRYFSAGRSVAGEPLATWGDDALECIVSRAKPAHATVLFYYGE